MYAFKTMFYSLMCSSHLETIPLSGTKRIWFNHTRNWWIEALVQKLENNFDDSATGRRQN